MDLGAGPGGPNRFCQLMFTDEDPKQAIPALKSYAEAVEKDGIAKLSLCAPFKKTIVGTDTYTDQGGGTPVFPTCVGMNRSPLEGRPA